MGICIEDEQAVEEVAISIGSIFPKLSTTAVYKLQ